MKSTLVALLIGASVTPVEAQDYTGKGRRKRSSKMAIWWLVVVWCIKRAQQMLQSD
jgi:hypothetical protein